MTARAKKMASCDFVAVAGMGDSAREGFSCVFGVVGEFRGYLCPSIFGLAGGGRIVFAIVNGDVHVSCVTEIGVMFIWLSVPDSDLWFVFAGVVCGVVVDELGGGDAEALLASLLIDIVVILAICSDIDHGSLSFSFALTSD